MSLYVRYSDIMNYFISTLGVVDSRVREAKEFRPVSLWLFFLRRHSHRSYPVSWCDDCGAERHFEKFIRFVLIMLYCHKKKLWIIEFRTIVEEPRSTNADCVRCNIFSTTESIEQHSATSMWWLYAFVNSVAMRWQCSICMLRYISINLVSQLVEKICFVLTLYLIRSDIARPSVAVASRCSIWSYQISNRVILLDLSFVVCIATSKCVAVPVDNVCQLWQGKQWSCNCFSIHTIDAGQYHGAR